MPSPSSCAGSALAQRACSRQKSCRLKAEDVAQITKVGGGVRSIIRTYGTRFPLPSPRGFVADLLMLAGKEGLPIRPPVDGMTDRDWSSHCVD